METPQPLSVNRAPHTTTSELTASLACFPSGVGPSLATATNLGDPTAKQVIYGALDRPGAVHVYRFDCPAGQRLRVQVLAPILQSGRALSPAVAVLAQGVRSEPGDVALPLTPPAGYAVITVEPPARLTAPLVDRWTGARFYAGPLIDQRTLVGGRCYIVVWSPDKQPGKYLLQVGYARRQGRLAGLFAWWRIRGWFGMSRVAGYVAVAVALLVLWMIARLLLAGGRAGATSDSVGNEG